MAETLGERSTFPRHMRRGNVLRTNERAVRAGGRPPSPAQRRQSMMFWVLRADAVALAGVSSIFSGQYGGGNTVTSPASVPSA